jgi:hypothetical protein
MAGGAAPPPPPPPQRSTLLAILPSGREAPPGRTARAFRTDTRAVTPEPKGPRRRAAAPFESEMLSQPHDPANAAPSAWAEPEDDASPAEALRLAFWAAFEAIGGAQGLADWGQTDPTQFFRLFVSIVSRDARNEPAEPYAYVTSEPLSEEEWKQSIAQYRP